MRVKPAKPANKKRHRLPELWLIAIPLIGAAVGGILAFGHMGSHQRQLEQQRAKDSRPHRLGSATLDGRYYELIVYSDTVTLHVSEGRKPVPMEEAHVTLFINGSGSSVGLSRVNGRGLEGRGSFDLERVTAATAEVGVKSTKREMLQFSLK